MKKSPTLREILYAPGTSYALEAHNGISAKIVERAGFPTIWVSSLTLSASTGHRDCNEISWTELVDLVSYIVDSTTISVLVDGDTGFGNFNNVRQLVKKLCRCGAAGICLEDKIFPKTNSLLAYNQLLAPVEEFVGKIKAAKDTQLSSDFCVVARTEAFIAGKGLDEALLRAYAYKQAGADALLIHSKKITPIEIEQFCKHWDYSIPLIIVPTKYAPDTSALYEKLRISLVIWANHLMRASITAMEVVAENLYRHQSSVSLDTTIAPIEKIFDLVDEHELTIAEAKYSVT